MKRTRLLTLLVLLILASCANQPRPPEPTRAPRVMHRAYLPTAHGGGVWGQGVAGCASPATMAALGAGWCYAWSPDCGGNPRCVPMFRPGASLADVPAMLESCGGRCQRAMLLNEPDLASQDNLTLAQQVAFVHDFGRAIRAHDTTIRIAAGGLWTPLHTDWPGAFVALYRATYPGQAIPVHAVHVHQYILDCGTHDLAALSGCTSGPYPPDAEQWRADLVAFADAVRAAFGPRVGVVLSEWGCLYDEFCFQQAVDWQLSTATIGPVPDALAGHAPFLCGDGGGFCCSLCDDGALTPLGAWYADQTGGTR